MIEFLFETAVLVGLLWWGWFEFVGGEIRLEIGQGESFFVRLPATSGRGVPIFWGAG